MELDAATITRAQRGDRTAQAVVLRRYAAPLHAFVRRVAPGPELEDEVQALLARLLEVLPRFALSGPATLSTWVFTVAHRWLLDERKRRHLRLAPMDEGLEVVDTSPGALQQVEAKQTAAALERAIQGLLAGPGPPRRKEFHP
jgi:RNA polymerase sigma-70 factor (ECF subfamily)